MIDQPHDALRDEPAFPHESSPGMTLRDYFAIRALQSLLTTAHTIGDLRDNDEFVAESYELADAMLRVRARN